jgi:hypothetical protein
VGAGCGAEGSWVIELYASAGGLPGGWVKEPERFFCCGARVLW